MRLCDDVIVRTTIDISDDAYQIAKTVAREQNRSLGSVVSDFITGELGGADASPLIPRTATKPYLTFRAKRRTTSEDARIAVDDEE